MSEIKSKPDGSSFVSGLSECSRCGPSVFLPLTGLMESMLNLYGDLQGALENNIRAFLKILVASPGIARHENEFECQVYGNVLDIVLGPVVFSNYELYVPRDGIGSARIQLPPVAEYEEGDEFFVVLHHAHIDEREYPVVPVDGVTTTANVIRRDSLSIQIMSDYFDSDIVPARIFVQDGAWVVDDWRHLYSMKLVPGGRTVRSDAPPHVGLPITNIKPLTFNLSNFRQSSVGLGPNGSARIDGAVGVINVQSDSINTGQRSIISVSWDAPPEADVQAGGGVAYYKIVLTPCRASNWTVRGPNNPTPIENESLEAYVYHYSGDNTGRIGTSVFVSPNTLYSISVYRVNDALEQIPAQSVKEIYCVSSLTSKVPTTEGCPNPISASVTPVGDSRTLRVHYNTTASEDELLYAQIFIREYEAWPVVPPYDPELAINRYLYYEGPVQDVFYQMSDASAGVAVIANLVYKEGNMNRDCANEVMMYRPLEAPIQTGTLPPSEIPFIVTANNIDMDPGGPGSGPAGFTTISQQVLYKECYISRSIATTPHGVDNYLGSMPINEGLWYPEDYSVASYVGAGGSVRIYVNGNLEASYAYNSQGRGERIFSPPIHIPAGSELRIDVGDATNSSYPFCMNVILYMFSVWRQA